MSYKRYNNELMEYSVNIEDSTYLTDSIFRDLSNKDHVVHVLVMVKSENGETECLICFRCREWISIVRPWTMRVRGSWPNS